MKSIRFVPDPVARAGRLCAQLRTHVRKVDEMPKKTGGKTAKKHGQVRDIFCVVSDPFRSFAHRSSFLLGSAWAFCGAVLVIVVWLVTGPTFHFSAPWKLIINTATTVITF